MQKNTFYSKVIAGTMTWGSWGKQFSKNQITDLMHHCLDVGITTFDHADIYGDYTNETDFGNAFFKSGISRESIQLISKCGIQFDAVGRKNRVKHYDYSKEYIIRSVERSLESLNTEYLDMLLLHRPSPLMHPDEVSEAILRLQNEGKVRDFGVSNFKPSQIAALETVVPVVSNQVEFSLTTNDVMYDGTLDDCLVNKRMAMSWSPLGTFFKENNETSERIRRVLTPMLEKYDATQDQLLLAWVLRHPSRVHPVVGTTTKPRLAAATAAANIDMEIQDWFLLLEAANGSEVP